MIKIESNKNIAEQVANIKRLLEAFGSNLDSGNSDDKKKAIELNDCSIFCSLMPGELDILEHNDKPDFIIRDNSNQKKIGLEHTSLQGQGFKQKEGALDSLILKSLKSFERNNTEHFGRYDIKFKPDFFPKKKDTQRNISLIIQAILACQVATNPIVNEIVSEIQPTPSDKLDFRVDHGSWWQKELTATLLFAKIQRKNKLVTSYTDRTNLPQWLLINLSNVNQSSLAIPDSFSFTIKTNFERIFILNSPDLFEIMTDD